MAFHPCDCISTPSDFGKSRDPKWIVEGASDSPSVEAAKIQHEFSMSARESIRRLFGSVSGYCAATGQDYQHVSRVLRGEIPARVEDLGQAVSSLGLSVRIASTYAKASHSGSLAAFDDRRSSLGAFYTPVEIADFLVGLVAGNETRSALEPSFGDGAFLQSLKRAGVERVTGVEVDEAARDSAIACGLLSPSDAVLADFLEYPISNKFDVVVGNPPYVRLRKTSARTRSKADKLGKSIGDVQITDDASLWLPFVVKSTEHLNQKGALAIVLPFEVTYVKYARTLWGYLGRRFEEIDVLRVHDRIFDELLQDVVLVVCRGRGGMTGSVLYSLFESRSDLSENRPSVAKRIPIASILDGERAFQWALAPQALQEAVRSSDSVTKVGSEARFHIGYVCGDKEFFHPGRDRGLPAGSMLPTALTTRSLAGVRLWTSESSAADYLWRPSGELAPEEREYVARGEALGVSSRYKCRQRSPWWEVPVPRRPDLLLSVFTDVPKIVINDAGWTFSNSLLGGYLLPGLNRDEFVASWYSPVTLLGIETEVHSLGGGVLVLVPGETSNITKLSSSTDAPDDAPLGRIDELLAEGRLEDAYHLGDTIAEKVLGPDLVDDIWKSIDLLRSWRRK